MKVTEQVAAFAEPVVQEHGCELWDVEYVREGSEYFLRLYIDKEGGVDIDDCEAISRAMDPILDEKDPVPGSYNGLKELPCVLWGYEDGKLTVESGKETITFEKSQVALVRLRVEF